MVGIKGAACLRPKGSNDFSHPGDAAVAAAVVVSVATACAAMLLLLCCCCLSCGCGVGARCCCLACTVKATRLSPRAAAAAHDVVCSILLALMWRDTRQMTLDFRCNNSISAAEQVGQDYACSTLTAQPTQVPIVQHRCFRTYAVDKVGAARAPGPPFGTCPAARPVCPCGLL
jgi:hypothetical protein